MLSNGNSNYDALLVTLEKRWSKGVSFLASYTASKNIADFTTSLERGLRSTADISVQNRYNLKAEKGLAAVDTPQRLVVSFSAAAPFGKGTNRLNSGAVGRVLEGWQINGILTAQNGQPVGILAPFDASGTGGVERGDCIAKPRSIRQSVDQWFDTSAFAVPALYHFGTCAPATGVRTPGLDSLDFSLFKEIHLTEQTRLEFRAELFNSLNHTQFGPPSNTVGTPGFGSIGSVQVDPREIQFAVKFYF